MAQFPLFIPSAQWTDRNSVVFPPFNLLAQICDAIDDARANLALQDRGELGDGSGHVLGQRSLEEMFTCTGTSGSSA
jgi:hypothetical protein